MILQVLFFAFHFCVEKAVFPAFMVLFVYNADMTVGRCRYGKITPQFS